VLQNKHFAGIATTDPHPILAEDAGDSGVQEPYDDAKCTMALERIEPVAISFGSTSFAR
jgi:hypothetical protein